MKYEYKKVTGYEQKKFIENGHTMFEEDVLERLKRLAYLEEQLQQANALKTSNERIKVCPYCDGEDVKKNKQFTCGDCGNDFNKQT